MFVLKGIADRARFCWEGFNKEDGTMMEWIVVSSIFFKSMGCMSLPLKPLVRAAYYTRSSRQWYSISAHSAVTVPRVL
ncbi:MAG: hypothetical protein ACO3N0_14950 [bacterium]